MSDQGSASHARERLNEALSATLDGQASEWELRQVLGRLDDPSLRAKAQRYQLAGDALRRDVNAFAAVDLSQSISAALADDPPLGQSAAPSRSSLLSWTGRFLERRAGQLGRVAIAASVVLAVVLGGRYQKIQQEEPLTVADSATPGVLNQVLQINANDYGASGILAGYGSQSSNETLSPEQLAQAQSIADRAIRERFRAYALQHAELAAMSTGQVILPFARLTSFDVQ